MLWSFVAATITITGCLVSVWWMEIRDERRGTAPRVAVKTTPPTRATGRIGGSAGAAPARRRAAGGATRPS